MIKKHHLFNSASVLLTLTFFLGSCVTPSASYITGVKRASVAYEKVEVYSTHPEFYEVVGYVEGWREKDIFMSTEKAEMGAVGEMKKTAGNMGGNGVILISIATEYIYIGGGKYGPNTYHVASGWAVYTPNVEPFSDVTEVAEVEKGRSERFKFYIEPPEAYEVLGRVSSRSEIKNLDMHHLLDTKSKAIGKALEELKQKAIKMGGNGLNILYVRRVKGHEHADLLDAILFNKEVGEVTEMRMSYVFSGQAIRVPSDD